jgi:hypothetical protein
MARKRIVRVTGHKIEQGFKHPLHELIRLERQATGCTYNQAKASVMLRIH